MKLTYIYYALLLACFINSLYFLRNFKVKVLAVLLLLSILTELCAEIDIHQKINYYAYYHFFTMAEYGLITTILAHCVKVKWLRIIMFSSIPLFAIACTLIILFIQDIRKFPSLTGGIEGTLLIIWCLRAFYDIEVTEQQGVFQQASFWLILAFYNYYVIVTPFNCVFNILQEDAVYRKLSTKSFSVINSVANYMLYILCMIGFYCLKQARSTRPSLPQQ